MPVHHLNCATLKPGRPRAPVDSLTLVAHCLLVERPEGLLLVDSGFGTADLATPSGSAEPFRAAVAPVLDPAETALAR